MNRHASAITSIASLATFRRRSAPVAVIMFAVFLFSMLPPWTRAAYAAPGEPVETAPETSQGSAPASGMGSPGGADTSDTGPGAPDLPVSPMGGYAYAYPFDLPHARGDVQPTLALRYASGQEWGIAGAGVDVPVPFIQTVYAPNTAPGKRTPVSHYVTHMGEELIAICKIESFIPCPQALNDEKMPGWGLGWTYYRPRVESGFSRYFLSPDRKTWRVQMKGAAIDMELGRALDGSYEALESHWINYTSEHIYEPHKWHAVRAYDGTNGAREQATPIPTNGIVLRYLRGKHWAPSSRVNRDDPAQNPIAVRAAPLYLSDIYATSPRDTPTTKDLSRYASHVRLRYEARRDRQDVFAKGKKVGERALRLVGVDVTSKPFASSDAARTSVRRYHLKYIEGSYGQISVLRSVEMEGACESLVVEKDEVLAETNCPRLPPVTFGYEGDPRPGIPDLVSHLGKLVKAREQVGDHVIRWVDVNHDGFDDIVITAPFEGKHALYLNGLDGKAGTFTEAAVPFAGVLGDTVDSLAERTQGVFHGDFDGNGKIDLLVAPPGERARMYELRGAGSSWSWAGRELGGFPVLPTDGNARAADVDHDGATDLIVTSDEYVLTYFSLAHVPYGIDQFGTAIWGEHGGAKVLPDPARAPLPMLETSGEPLPFAHANVHLADMNGDRRLDYVYVAKDGVRVWLGAGTGVFGDSTSDGEPSTRVEPSALMPLGDTFATDPKSWLRFGDTNGDGFDDMIRVTRGDLFLWTNDHAGGFTSETLLRAPNEPPAAAGFVLADLFGHGFVGGVWNVGDKIEVSTKVQTPRLLRTISNGYGVTTRIRYDDLTALELQRRAGALRPEMTAPVSVVTEIKASDNLDLVGGTKHETVTKIAYDGAYIAPETKRFGGFRTVTATHVGDTTHPTEHVRVVSYLGECQDDPDTTANDCSVDRVLWANPRAALALRPQYVERFDDAGVYHSTTSYVYRLRPLYVGQGQAVTRHAYRESTHTYLYPTTGFEPQASATALVRVITEHGSLPQTVENFDVLQRGKNGVETTTARTVDVFGNATESRAFGRPAKDLYRNTHHAWARPAGETTGWTFRPVRRWVTGANPNVVTRDSSTVFNRDGKPASISAVLSGSLPLSRATLDPAKPPPAPANASTDRTVTLTRFQYDDLGNVSLVRAPNHRCTGVTMDSVYGTLPTDSTQYAGALGQHSEEGDDDACGSVELKSFATFDRGLEKVKDSLGYHGEKARLTFDGFGRPTAVYKPRANDNAPGDLAARPAVKFTYHVTPDVPLSRSVTETLFVEADGTHGYRQTWTFADGFGRALATIRQADTSAGDDGTWIVSGVHTRTARGSVNESFLPFFWSGTPQIALFGALAPTSKSTRATRDAFGRTVDTFGLDGARTSHRNHNEALSVEIYDAEDLNPNSFSTPTTVRRDGFGHVISETVVNHTPTTFLETLTTSYAYDLHGAIERIEQSKPGAPAVARTFRYDSFGRPVENVEPNSNTRRRRIGAPGFITRAWRYAYNDNGDLVGTSDARGCGKNLHYDTGGRLLAEDYVPCEAAHAPYTEPNLTTGEGTETFYRYDAAPSDGSAARLEANPYFALGRLTAVYDRAGSTAYRYDSRGRTTGITKRLAKPGDIVAADLGDRYTPHWFVKEAAFKEDENVAWSSTGVDADLPELLGKNGVSTVTPVYSRRGVAVGMTSSYGDLLKSTTRSAEGLTLSTVYGDAAETTTTATYDGQLRAHTIETARAKATGWSAEPAAISPPPSSATTQLILESLEYTYDRVGNPLTIQDHRDAAEWPAGAKPASHTFKYDSLYRLVDATTTYAGGNAWTSPFEAETTRTPDDSARDRVAPHLKFDARIQHQTWAYDYLGNTTKTTDDAHGFADRSLGTITNGTATDGPNRITAASDPGHGSLAVTYDAAGNMTGLAVEREGTCLPAGASCSQRYAYTWDEVGRLARAQRWNVSGTTESFGADLHYAYDANGTRVRKTASPVGAADRHTLYVFGSLELRRALFDGTDYERTIKTTAVRLGSLARVVYADEGLPEISSGKQHVFLTLPGHLGSAATIIDRDTGELVEKAAYQPFGAKESDYRPDRWASFREELGFTGKEEDIEVGLLYFGARYLVPALGRWASPDPLTVHAAGADLNAYAYVGGHTTVSTDPTGLMECLFCRRSDPGGGNGTHTPSWGSEGGAGGGSSQSAGGVLVAEPVCFEGGVEVACGAFEHNMNRPTGSDDYGAEDEGGREGEESDGKRSAPESAMETAAKMAVVYALARPHVTAEDAANIFELGIMSGAAGAGAGAATAGLLTAYGGTMFAVAGMLTATGVGVVVVVAAIAATAVAVAATAALQQQGGGSGGSTTAPTGQAPAPSAAGRGGGSGARYEAKVASKLGGEGAFKVQGREFDGRIGNRWWEAKSGRYWEFIAQSPENLAKFQSDMGARLGIARANGATYELFSENSIPQAIQTWLTGKGIPFTEGF